jgi:AcrR family transcriptional regulator
MVKKLDRRQRRRQATIEEIKAIARQQIAEQGATGLSLGAIARAMGLTPPALYRYFDSRNDLVATLVIEAYDSMGEAMEIAVAGLPEDDYAGQFLALMRAYRGWALEHPEAYALMYGASGAEVDLSGERGERFQRAVMRSMWAMVQVLCAAHDAHVLRFPTQYQAPPATVQRALDWMRSILPVEDAPLGILALALTTWIRADGLVWQELHGHLPKALFGDGDLYGMESSVLAERLGLTRQAGADGSGSSMR